MPITFSCSCGKRLSVKDEFAGRRVKCPACGGVCTAPAAEPAFEVIEEVEAPPPVPAPRAARAVATGAKPVARTRTDDFEPADDEDEKPRKKRRRDDDDDEDEDDRPRSRRRRDDDDDEDDDRPRSRRRRDDDDDEDEDDRPRRKRKSRRGRVSHHSGNTGKRIGYVVGGVVLVLIGIGIALLGWNGQGRGATKALILGVCLVVGGLGTAFKGLLGNVDDE
jgi:hypothetical protein